MSAKKLGGAAVRRKSAIILSCSTCGRRVPIQAYEDPDEGDGWPMHKCSKHAVRSFDSFELDTPATRPPIF